MFSRRSGPCSVGERSARLLRGGAAPRRPPLPWLALLTATGVTTAAAVFSAVSSAASTVAVLPAAISSLPSTAAVTTASTAVLPAAISSLPSTAAVTTAVSAASSAVSPEEAQLARMERLGLTDAFRNAVFEDSGNDRIGWFDENGDGRRDEVDDVYFFDHGADGTVNRVIDWTDSSGDGRADRQLLVYVTPGALGPGLNAFVVENRSGDSHFWHTVRGEYLQSVSEFRSDFHGDSFFAAIRWDEQGSSWTSFDENPFCFYDPNGDGLSEEVLRVSGIGLTAHSFRWSFDTDDDSAGPGRDPSRPGATDPDANVPSAAEPDAAGPDANVPDADHEPYAYAYDYDLSLTGIVRSLARGDVVDTLSLRPGLSVALLSWDRAREWAAEQHWYRVVLTFDENDRNVDPGDPQGRGRWEGVIATPPDGFPPVGNPGCGRLGKRYEQRDGLPGGPALYFHPIDGRVHLTGASRGSIEIDRDGDGVADASLEMQDRDGDGYFDTWLWDGDGDGSYDHTYRAPEGTAVEPVGLDFASLRDVEARVRAETGLVQGERFAAEVDVWTRAGRFVSSDSLSTWRAEGR